MRLRIASVAFLLGVVSTGVAWLSIQPVLVSLLDSAQRVGASDPVAGALVTRIRGFLPFALALDLVVVTVLCFAVLQLAVGRPLRRTEETIEQLSASNFGAELSSMDRGGPLLARLQRALQRLAQALSEEQAVTRAQLNELRATNARLAQAHTELVASERLATVGRLSAGVAHEIGNPLSGVLGYLALIRERLGGRPEVLELLDRVDAEVQRIDQIVRSMLDLGRPPKGKLVPVEVEQVIRASVELAQAGPEFRDVAVHLSLEPGLIARAESGSLSQVLLNLLLNAAQAVNGKGAIWVSASQDADRLSVCVEDDGPGIPPEVLPRLFEPFFTTKESGKGNGLGLAVSRHLAASMGGELSAGSSPRGGAAFVLTLLAPA